MPSPLHPALALGPPPNPFHRLSAEILVMICRLVFEGGVGGKRFPNRRQDLISLGKTCKLLHDVSQPLLYIDISTGGPKLHPGERKRPIDLSNLVRSVTPSSLCY